MDLNRNLLGAIIWEWDTPTTSITAPGRVIIQYRKNTPVFIVHWQNKQDGGLYHGFYTDELPEALTNASERLRRHGWLRDEVSEEVRS